MDRASSGREVAQRGLRGHPQGWSHTLPADQQNRTRIGQEDPDQGYQLPAHGEHPAVRLYFLFNSFKIKGHSKNN